MTANKLPTIDHSQGLLIHGVVLKFNDGRWSAEGGELTGATMIALGTIRGLQCWERDQNGPPETIIEQPGGEPLPSADRLNAGIPEIEWAIGLDGKPRPPWQLNYVVYLLNPGDASLFTSINCTVGQRIAYERLTERVSWMRGLRGENVFPLVKLDARPMKAKQPGVMKLRPEFTIAGWRSFGDTDDGGALAPPTPPKQLPPTSGTAAAAVSLGKPVEPVSAREALNDEIPF